jgi:hypothetical protein
MRLVGPYRYTVSVLDGSYAVLNEKGRKKFLSPVTTGCPKLYVFADDTLPVYVGQTLQGMAARMRLGFLADGTSGYHGYSWRHSLPSAQLLVWCLEDISGEDPRLALECIEAEIVFAYRLKYDQWPRYQTEIHFHQTSAEHRKVAAQVMAFFTGVPARR